MSDLDPPIRKLLSEQGAKLLGAKGALALTGEGFLISAGLGILAHFLGAGQPAYKRVTTTTRVPLPTDRLPVVYGTHRVPGTYLYLAAPPKADALWMVVGVSHGEIDSIQEIYIDGHLAFTADGAPRNSGLTYGYIETVSSGYPAQVRVVPAILRANAGGGAGSTALTVDYIGPVGFAPFLINEPIASLPFSVGDSFTIAGESGSPTHVVTAVEQLTPQTIILHIVGTPIAAGGVAAGAKITYDWAGMNELWAPGDAVELDLVPTLFNPPSVNNYPTTDYLRFQGSFQVLSRIDRNTFTINQVGFSGFDDLAYPITWRRLTPDYASYATAAKYLGPDTQDMGTTGKQPGLVGTPMLKGGLTAGATVLALDGGDGLSLSGVVHPGDTFTIAGESGSPVHTVVKNGTNSRQQWNPYQVLNNKILALNFTPGIAVGGAADDAALTFSYVGFTANLLAQTIPEWSSPSHKLGGVAYVLLRLGANDQLFPQSLPNVEVNVRGRKVYDPRTGLTAWSQNPAVCARDLMTNTRYGWSLPAANINDGNASFGVIAEANYHDTQPYQPLGTGMTLITQVLVSGDVIIAPGHGLSGAGTHQIWVRGNSVIPDGQYGVTVTDANTLALVGYTILANGSESGTVQEVGLAPARHTCNGVLDCNQPILRGLEAVLSAGRAELLRIGKIYQPFTRRALGQTVLGYVLDDSRQIGSLELKQAGLQGSANALDVTFEDAAQAFQRVTFPWPPLNTPNQYLIDDGETVNRKPLELPFTTDRYMAWRISNAILRELRSQNTIIGTAAEDLLVASGGDVIAVANRYFGWGPTEASPSLPEKLFWIIQLGLRIDQLLDFMALDYEATAYDDILLDDAVPLPLSSLPDPWFVAVPTLPASGHLCSTGTPDPRIHVEWVAADDGSVKYYEVEAQRTVSGAGVPADADFRSYGRASVDLPALWIPNVANGDVWDVRVFAVNSLGRRSLPLEEVHTAVVLPGATVAVVRTASAAKITYQITAQGTTRYVELYVTENAGAGGTNPSETPPFLAYSAWVPVGGTVTWDVAVKTGGDYIRALVVPYDESIKRGTDSGYLEDQSVSSGAAPSAAPSGVTFDSNTTSTISFHWNNNGDSASVTRFYVNGVIVGQSAAGATTGVVTIHGAPTPSGGAVTVLISVDHYRNGQASTRSAEVSMSTATPAGGPATFEAGAPYLINTVKPYVAYDLTWDSSGGAWEIYEGTVNDVTQAIRIASGASGGAFTVSRLEGTAGNWYYWVRWTGGPSAWTVLGTGGGSSPPPLSYQAL